jgi:hypothetical protein
LDGGFFKGALFSASDTGVGIIELGRTLEIEGLTVTGRLTKSTVIGVFGVVDFMEIPAALEVADADGSARVSVS